MKYNGFYFWMFKSPMKKVLTEKYGKEYAADIMKKSQKVYRELVEKADDIGEMTTPWPTMSCLRWLLSHRIWQARRKSHQRSSRK